MTFLRTLVRLKLLPVILFVIGFVIPILFALPNVIPFTFMAAFFVGTFGATIGLILHMVLAQNRDVQGDPAKAGSQEKIKAAVELATAWLDKQPEVIQRAFVLQLAENLTVTIRASVSQRPEIGTIQMANELLHVAIGWLQKPNTFSQSASEMLKQANLAFSRAEDFRPGPDVDLIEFAITSAMKSVQL